MSSIFTFSIIWYIYQYVPKRTFHQQSCFPLVTYPGHVQQESEILGPPKKKTIVWLDILHQMQGLRNSVSSAKFDRCLGIASNCEMLPHVIVKPRMYGVKEMVGPLDADAVLVMGCHMINLPTPVRRDPNQIYVFVERENWYHYSTYDKIEYRQSKEALRDQMNHFNWTMTYRLDSDILLMYGYIIPNPNPQQHPQLFYENIFKKKRHSVVWFVSHCPTPSLRLHYVNELKKYIEVHIYGDCGDLKCRDKTCFEQIVAEHKFVLSFENTYYQNYVTEKLFSWFSRNIIQVLRGGGIDYTLYGLPDQTFIDADAFQSPEALANFLKALGNDETTYIEYLKRKNNYMAIDISTLREAAYCSLCAKLNEPNKLRKSYTHIGAWYASNLFQDHYCPNDPQGDDDDDEEEEDEDRRNRKKVKTKKLGNKVA